MYGEKPQPLRTAVLIDSERSLESLTQNISFSAPSPLPQKTLICIAQGHAVAAKHKHTYTATEMSMIALTNPSRDSLFGQVNCIGIGKNKLTH